MNRMKKAGAALLAVCTALTLASSVQAAAPKSITLSAGAMGQTWYMVSALLGEELKKPYPNTRMTVMAGGGVANVKLLAQGKIDFGMTSTDLFVAAQQGHKPYKRAYKGLVGVANVQALSPFYFMVEKSKGLKSIKDFADKKMPLRICTFKKAGPPAVSALRLLQEYGVTPAKLVSWGGKINFMTWQDCVALARDGHVDALVGATGYPSPFHAEVASVRKMDLLPVPRALSEKLKKKYGYISVTIPKGAYGITKKDMPVFGWSGYILTQKKTPNELVYNLTKAMYENAGRIQRLHAAFRTFDPKKMPTDIPGPIHPGAARFYKQKGLLN